MKTSKLRLTVVPASKQAYEFGEAACKRRLILPDAAPRQWAQAFVEKEFTLNGVVVLHYYRDEFYFWKGTHYRRVDRKLVRAKIYEFLDRAWVLKKGGMLEPFNPTAQKVTQTEDALASRLYLDSDLEQPFRIAKPETRMPDFVACRNGQLEVATRKLTLHSPHLFTVNASTVAYEPNAPKPERWLQFLDELWPEDAEARETLCELFGWSLTADTSLQKIGLIVGPRRSGKGTIAHVLTSLLGKDSVAAPTVSSLTTQFGLWPLIDKRLAVIADARMGKASLTVIERLLSLSGEDTQTVDRKYLAPWTGKPTARIVILTNELPHLADAAAALPSRFIVLMMTRSFLGKEDPELKAKLEPELPGILNWALSGLERLKKRGRFQMPRSSLDALQQMEDLAAPVTAFVREECTIGKNLRIDKSLLFAAWAARCSLEGEKAGTQRVFGRNLLAANPSIRPGHSGTLKIYRGVDLKGPKGPRTRSTK